MLDKIDEILPVTLEAVVNVDRGDAVFVAVVDEDLQPELFTGSDEGIHMARHPTRDVANGFGVSFVAPQVVVGSRSAGPANHPRVHPFGGFAHIRVGPVHVVVRNLFHDREVEPELVRLSGDPLALGMIENQRPRRKRTSEGKEATKIATERGNEGVKRHWCDIDVNSRPFQAHTVRSSSDCARLPPVQPCLVAPGLRPSA